jgi:hypothetical protein
MVRAVVEEALALTCVTLFAAVVVLWAELLSSVL